MLQAPIITTTFVIIGTVLVLFFLVFFYLLITQMHRRRMLHKKEMLDLKTQYEQTILQAQLEIQEQTFRNISQEIHDNIGQVLSLAKLNLNTFGSDPTEEKVAITEELLSKAITDLRDLSKSLNTEKISDIGLVAAIGHELNIIKKAVHLETELAYNSTAVHLNPEQTIVVFRMMQESFNNILKHAKATLLCVKIDAQKEGLYITITDNGIGFDIEKLNSHETGIGLKSMKQRAELIGGNVNITSRPQEGTVINISILQEKNPEV
jgi:signal transduction histidine kinase